MIAELSEFEHQELRAEGHCNADLAPVPAAGRKWRAPSFAALWISMSACIPTYMLASSLIGGGMDWRQAVATVFLGNLIVLVPMILNAHAGTKYGIPFPVYCRAAFGVKGANIPALLRALVACGWFGIQAWIGGDAIYRICAVLFGLHVAPAHNWFGITAGQFACFMLFWGVNMWVIYKGIDTIRFLLNIKAPLLVALGLLLLGWAYVQAGGFGPMLSQPSAFVAGGAKAGQFWGYFFPALTGMVGFWATLSLNIPDFSRYAVSQKDQALGQAFGLPLTMALYAFIGVAVTSATAVIYHETLWNPVDVLTHFKNPVVLAFAMLALAVATLATNIAANVVSPANDFAHLAPRKISFRTGGLITGVIGILMMPWKLIADPNGYIFTWLIAYSALLGPVGGILIADYFVWRKRDLALKDLYKQDGRYGSFSPAAVVALVAGVLPSLPGFLVQVKLLAASAVPQMLVDLYNYAWFIGFGIAFIVYLALRRMAGAQK
ncbi:MAG: NCS1 family nucleobase:cation symporter-1 [Alphaproteobacteria bacterium]|nr:NCS1 family nucleobase:cation symporter-1 [Alphaproteobacteria bacterium]MDE2336576.1 NCS1 family nucleobase:cation symporter-1 [Alphaproteobacteria bacterium]